MQCGFHCVWIDENFELTCYFLSFFCVSARVWQIGRIPNEWARCLLPLVREKKIRVEGSCKYAPEVLSIMDTIHLSIRYSFVNNVSFLEPIKLWLL